MLTLSLYLRYRGGRGGNKGQLKAQAQPAQAQTQPAQAQGNVNSKQQKNIKATRPVSDAPPASAIREATIATSDSCKLLLSLQETVTPIVPKIAAVVTTSTTVSAPEETAPTVQPSEVPTAIASATSAIDTPSIANADDEQQEAENADEFLFMNEDTSSQEDDCGTR
jgi:hypothetical protein